MNGMTPLRCAAREECHTVLRLAFLGVVFAALLSPRAALAQGRPRAGDLAVELALGRSMTFTRNPVGRTASDVSDPMSARFAAGLHLGGGVWVEGTLRATPSEGFAGVRWFTGGAGMRFDTSDGATLSTSVRLGWCAAFTGGVSHGAHASFAVNVRPTRALTLFVETGIEAFPGMAFERTTANGRVREQSLVAGTLWYGGGVRFAL